jgi:hypothetical protein
LLLHFECWPHSVDPSLECHARVSRAHKVCQELPSICQMPDMISCGIVGWSNVQVSSQSRNQPVRIFHRWPSSVVPSSLFPSWTPLSKLLTLCEAASPSLVFSRKCFTGMKNKIKYDAQSLGGMSINFCVMSSKK